MKSSEIKELSNNDLVEKIGDMEEQQDKLLLTHSVSPLENPLVLRANRRTIARLKTALKVRVAGETLEVETKKTTAKVKKTTAKVEAKEEAPTETKEDVPVDKIEEAPTDSKEGATTEVEKSAE